MMLNNLSCDLCEKKDAYPFLCLICGTKVCGNKNCLSTTLTKRRYVYFSHSAKCGMGNTVYVDLDYGEIILIRQSRVIFPKIFIYLNQFGAALKKSNKF